jgi:hypothetical protein
MDYFLDTLCSFVSIPKLLCEKLRGAVNDMNSLAV